MDDNYYEALDGFKPLLIGDRREITRLLALEPPQTSELTFTNLFIWRRKNRPAWREKDGALLIIMNPLGAEEPFGLPPVGGGPAQALDFLMGQLARLTTRPRVERADKQLAAKAEESGRYQAVQDRDQADYVYLAEDLINLAGRRYHRKKNHVNRFVKGYEFEYTTLDINQVECFLNLQETWCQIRKCQEDPDLMHEDLAIYEAMVNFENLDFTGGAIAIDKKIEAFSLGEMLNPQTAVIHIEKANPEIPGLYAVINQRFAKQAWGGVKYLNREQDLGIPGLRQAKESYLPDHLVEKYVITPR